MVRDIAARSGGGIELRDFADEIAQPIQAHRPCREPALLSIRQHERQKIIDVAVPDEHAAIHIALPEGELRIQGEPFLDPPIPEHNGDRLATAIAVPTAYTVCKHDRQVAVDHEMTQEVVER
jgi:hypothetical protein